MILPIVLVLVPILARWDTALLIAAEQPISAQSTAPSRDEPLRTWSDATGQHHTEAVLLRLENGKVWLRRKDGTQIAVPLDKLSEADRNYLRRWPSTVDTSARNAPNDSHTDLPALLAKGGEAWLSLERYEAFQTKLVAGKRFWIWPVEDLPLAVDEQGL